MKKIWNSYNFIFVFAFICFFFASILISEPEDIIDSYQTITIQEDENLWIIAENYLPEHNLPLVDFVEWVESNNDLSSTQLKAGQEIVIPVKVEENILNNELQLASK